MELKVSYPEECDDILKEIKKGKVKKKDLKEPFKDKHVHYNIDEMARLGVIRRSHVLEDGKLMITYEDTGKKPKFKQGRRNYPKVKP